MNIGCAAFVTAAAILADAFEAIEAVAGFRFDFVKLALHSQAVSEAEQDRELIRNHAISLGRDSRPKKVRVSKQWMVRLATLQRAVNEYAVHFSFSSRVARSFNFQEQTSSGMTCFVPRGGVDP
jgi:hypothetical protein